jgi:hypothetical protein
MTDLTDFSPPQPVDQTCSVVHGDGPRQVLNQLWPRDFDCPPPHDGSARCSSSSLSARRAPPDPDRRTASTAARVGRCPGPAESGSSAGSLGRCSWG